jgi:RNA-dependent RNA polymerase
MEQQGRGLGLMGNWKGVEKWYGGKVQFTSRLRRDKASKSLILKLNQFETGKSNRCTRRVGSLSILQVKLEKTLKYDEKSDAEVKKFLHGPLVICGRQYRPFQAKEGKTFFVETNEDFERDPVQELGDQLRMSFEDFMAWQNNLKLNANQVRLKLAQMQVP